ncbi:DUF4231 domain-containing protein [Nocardia sp. R7R-8]|uniref:DUF4231 domain-containing protein n=1 Tax=Nocardia sp. R7R-8 TaxID=3459304 RepID=UPI00403DB3A9
MQSTDDAGPSESASTGLPLTTAEGYISGRLEQYQQWYDGKSVKTKALHLRMRVVAVGGGVLVPALVNLPYVWAAPTVTVISLLVAGSVALESVFRYREQWKNYRSTEQLLGHEKVYFQTRTGSYEGLGDGAAFRQLVERVEAAIASENSATLNVMTTAQQATELESPRG